MKRILFVTLLALGLARSSRAADLVWTPLASATWDTSALNLNWTNPTAGGPLVAYVAGDNVRFDDTGLNQSAVTLSGALTPGSVVVDTTGSYSFLTGTLAGSVPLFKRGTGLLILGSNNTISGPTSIEGGQLQIGNAGSTGSVGSGWITNLSGLVINRTGTLNLNNSLSGAGGFTNKLNATVNMWGTNTMSGPIFIQLGQLSLSNAPSQGSSSTIILDGTLPGGTANARLVFTGGINLPSGTTISMMNTIASPLTRCTLGTGSPADTATNSVSGPILIGSGNGAIQFNAVSTGTGRLQINGNISNHPDNATPFSGSFYVRGAGNGTLNGSVNLPQASFIRTDAGTFTVGSSGNHFSGILIAAGTLRLGIDNALPNNVPFSMGQGAGAAAVLDLNGHNQQVASLVSVTPFALAPIVTNSSATDALLTLSDGGDYYGAITDSGSTGKIGLRILNPGAPNTQQLHALCNYSGPTTLELATAISLVGSGDIPNTTPIQMANGSSIESRYKSDATFTLGAAQTLKADGTANIGGYFASQGTIALRASKSGGTITADNISIASGYSITYGGTLYLELSGDPLGGSDELKLFTADSYSGSFSFIVPPNPGPGRTWDTSTLTTDGKLRINSTLPTDPTNITATVVAGGTELKLDWPASYTGWALQAQTNAPGVGLTPNWHFVPDSDKVNTVNMPIDPANGSVFFRMVLP